jgi:hypothetical protein
MKRLFLSVKHFFWGKPVQLENLSGQSITPNFNEPVISENPKIVLSSRDDNSTDFLSSRIARNGDSNPSYRKVLLEFIKNEPRAKRGFTAVELYHWMGEVLPMSAISKTLYRMRICGEVVSEVKEGDGRIRIWKLVS